MKSKNYVTDLTMSEGQKFVPQQDVLTFYKGSTIFVTGVTGFLGHVLLSKLLCSCPDIKKIYILIREKRGKDIWTRFQEIFDQPVFEKAKKCCPDYTSIVTPIRGDCLKPNLGISDTDRDLLQEEVNIIFHVAATVRFDAPLRDAVYINIRSTSDLLDIAKGIKNLQVFVHVSTAFSYCAEHNTIEEKVYEPPMFPQNILSIVDHLNDTILDRITPRLLGPYPNTYVLTKAIAESLCLHKNTGIPITVFRPAIVISTAEEPIPGWINNTYGPTGIVAAAGIGLLRTLNADKNCKANVVPCDYVINAMIAAAWYTAETWKTFKQNTSDEDPAKMLRVPIFNYSSTETNNSLTWKAFMEGNEKFEQEIPFSYSMWAYSLTLNKYKFVHQVYVIFLHLLPALIVDSIAVLCGKEPRLWESYQKVHKLTNVISYFSTRQWIIPHENVKKLWNCLSPGDKQIFQFNLENLDWKTYFKNHVFGIRTYIIKDKETTIPYALKKRKKLIFTHYAVISLFLCLISYFCLRLLQVVFK
ncbi:fatty acyl-CoA reductase wat-like isoform X2 [Planococcus citri]|uniref:fatty acyl-CoA reductase wat-like isoform X2 n=1 Tax=Planococcus citri TaxID=170843 RepID=UPI0031F907A5